MRLREPAAKPPCEPRDFESVPRTTSHPSLNPHPRGPSTPSACASSTTVMAPYVCARIFSSTRGARSPSIEKRLSVTSKRRRWDCARFNTRSASAASACRYTRSRAPESRAASIREAWHRRSITIASPAPASAVSTPILAIYPAGKTSADSCASHCASASSKATCTGVWPLSNRDDEEPAPHSFKGFCSAGHHLGMPREVQIIIRRKINQRRIRDAQLPAHGLIR